MHQVLLFGSLSIQTRIFGSTWIYCNRKKIMFFCKKPRLEMKQQITRNYVKSNNTFNACLFSEAEFVYFTFLNKIQRENKEINFKKCANTRLSLFGFSWLLHDFSECEKYLLNFSLLCLLDKNAWEVFHLLQYRSFE